MASKYTQIDEPLLITKCEQSTSMHGGTTIYKIWFMGIKSQHTHYHTWADPLNVNWKYWQHIVPIANDKGIVLNNLKLKDDGKGLVNADSTFKIEYVGDLDTVMAELQRYWESVDSFNKLFDTV